MNATTRMSEVAVQPFDAGLPDAKPDVYWNIVLELVDAHLRTAQSTNRA
ncbi:hypothetical protein [Loktanella fryxellensis]|nr:hypothetical protein [Loktanella fryxellensis]